MYNNYEGFKWIKVKKEKAIEINGVFYVTEKHHVEEAEFLINEIRKLASVIDDLNKNK